MKIPMILWWKVSSAPVVSLLKEQGKQCPRSPRVPESNWKVHKHVLSTMGVSKESTSKFLIRNRFHVKLRILSPENCKQSFYGRERIGGSNYHDSQGEFWPKLKQCLTDWTKEALSQSFRTRAFWLFPAFVLRHFLSHCCATSSRSLSDRELSAGEVPLDLAEFCHVVALAPLH